MLCILTTRRLKPGHYDQFREAWQPDNWPSNLGAAHIARNIEDENEVATWALFDGTVDELDALRDDPEFLRAEEARIRRIAEHEDGVVLNAIYEIVETVGPKPAG